MHFEQAAVYVKLTLQLHHEPLLFVRTQVTYGIVFADPFGMENAVVEHKLSVVAALKLGNGMIRNRLIEMVVQGVREQPIAGLGQHPLSDRINDTLAANVVWQMYKRMKVQRCQQKQQKWYQKIFQLHFRKWQKITRKRPQSSTPASEMVVFVSTKLKILNYNTLLLKNY